MKKGYLLYALTLIFALSYALGMQQYAGWVILIVTVIFPFFEIAACWFLMRGNLSVEVSVKDGELDEARRQVWDGGKRLHISMGNEADFLTIGHGEMVLDIENAFTGRRRREKLSFSVDAGMRESIVLADEFCCPGRYRIFFRRICAYDFLGLVPIPLEWIEPREITVMPEPVGDLQNLVLNGEEWEGLGEIYSRVKTGSDASELLDIREYRQGDMRNRIHWKQTVKREKLMVKDYAFPLDYGVGLFIDLNWDKRRRIEEGIAGQIQSAYLLGLHLVMDRIPFLLVWYDARQERLMRGEVWTEKDLYETFAELLKGRVYSSEKCLAAEYREAGGKRLQEACYFSSDRIYEFEYLWTLLESGHLQIKRWR